MKLEERLQDRWTLPHELFGDIGSDIHDFELHNYTYFLDNVISRENLVMGLQELSPLADDALRVAERMTDGDFRRFKTALQVERRQENTVMPEKYFSLLIPKIFITAMQIAERFQVPLGAAAIRVIELGL